MALVKVYTAEEFNDNVEKGAILTYVTAGNGNFEHRKSWLGESFVKVPARDIPGYKNLEEYVKLKELDVEKIPIEALYHVMYWYKVTTDKTGKEAQVNFYRRKGKTTITIDDEEKDLFSIPGMKKWTDDIFSYTPKQSNSSALTDAKDPIYDELNKQFGMYVETHSHNSMAAFKSGTDEANSGNDAVQLVFGKFKTQEVEMFSWVTVRGLQYDGLTTEELKYYIEMPNFNSYTNNRTYFPIQDIYSNIDEDLIAEWDKQVLPTIAPRTKFFGAFSGQTTSYTNYPARTAHTSTYYGQFEDTEINAQSYYNNNTKFRSYKSRILDTTQEAMELFILDYGEFDGLDIAVKSYIAGTTLATYTLKTDSMLVEAAYDHFVELFITDEVLEELNSEIPEEK